MASAVEWTDVDRRIWEEELDEFVPRRVFDVHTHLYRWAFNADPNKETGPYRRLLGDAFADAPWELAEVCDRVLMPGREVHRLSFPFPFPHPCDFDASNEYVARETARDPASAALMLVHPGMSAEAVEAALDRHGFLGFKPYRFYARSGDPVNCLITDFMPEHLVAVADRRGLLIMMHLSRKDAVADEQNVRDLLRLYDTSSVCESDAIEALYAGVGPGRVMYGSDDVPVGVLRGKYVAFGYAWAYLSPTNHRLDLSHCEGQMTFTRYEQLRAMRRAARRLGLTRAQHEAVFHDTAAALVAAVRAGRQTNS